MKKSMNLSEKHRAALMSAPWFAGLQEAVRADIVKHARPQELPAKDRLHSRGSPGDCIYGILEGCIRVRGVTENGRSAVLDFYGPGTWFGEVAAINRYPRMHDADAYTNSAVLRLSTQDLDKLMTDHPALCRALLGLEAERLRIVLTAIEQYSTQTLEHRLAHRLLMLMASFAVRESNGILIDLYLPQETLAELIGATRQRVNQILQVWETQQILDQTNGRIILLNESRLRQVAAPIGFPVSGHS
jgi:CRP-like cAMP-binding protein